MVVAAGAAVVGADLSGELVPGVGSGAVETEGTGEADGEEADGDAAGDDVAGADTVGEGLSEGDASCAITFPMRRPPSRHSETIPATKTFFITCFFSLQRQEV